MRTVLSSILIYIVIYSFFIPIVRAGGLDSVSDSKISLLLEKAYLENPVLRAKHYEVLSAKKNKTAVSFLKDPVVGISTLNRNMETKYMTVGQSIEFPVKYYYKNRGADFFIKSRSAEYELEKLTLRKKVLSLYFALYAEQKVSFLTMSNMETVKEVARVAERKYAAGRGSQSEAMRAHLELTNLELELIRLEEKVNTLQLRLKELLNDSSMEDIDFGETVLYRPMLSEKSFNKETSLKVKSAFNLYKAAQMNSKLSKWDLAPDFDLRYQKRISGVPEDSDIFTVGVTIPLWFWKNKAEIDRSKYMESAKRQLLIAEENKAEVDIKSLKQKIDVATKTLVVYETSLIPQALGAFNSTKSAYRANKAGFSDLLDSEQLLYKIKQNYYRTLSSYVDLVTSFEVAVGRELLEI